MNLSSSVLKALMSSPENSFVEHLRYCCGFLRDVFSTYLSPKFVFSFLEFWSRTSFWVRACCWSYRWVGWRTRPILTLCWVMDFVTVSRVGYYDKFILRNSDEELAQAAWGSGRVTVPGIVQETWRCAIWRHGLVDVVVWVGVRLDYLEVFSNLNDSMTLGKRKGIAFRSWFRSLWSQLSQLEFFLYSQWM